MMNKDGVYSISNLVRPPDFSLHALKSYRLERVLEQMRTFDVAMCVLVNPLSLRYVFDYRSFGIFMSHIPSTYSFLGNSGHYILHNAFDPNIPSQLLRKGRPISYMYGGDSLEFLASKFASDIVDFLSEIGSTSRRIAVECVNPSITKALLDRGLEVLDGGLLIDRARIIKSKEEVKCIRWSIKVAELAAGRVKQALLPGVTELQLWSIFNSINLVNDGDWHEGRMLASGPRTNPWLQEASQRRIQSGDLVGFDTDMIGPMGYFADLSRTFLCGKKKATRRQKEIYRLAVKEVEHNLRLIRPGITFEQLQKKSYNLPEEFHSNAYTCIVHGAGMSDEFPHIHPVYRGPMDHDGELVAGMVLCVESYVGAVQDSYGVKLEQQILVTEDGYVPLMEFPYEEDLI